MTNSLFCQEIDLKTKEKCGTILLNGVCPVCSKKRESPTLEYCILEVLDKSERPLTASEIIKEIKRQFNKKYNSVRSKLTTLLNEGSIHQQWDLNRFVYSTNPFPEKKVCAQLRANNYCEVSLAKRSSAKKQYELEIDGSLEKVSAANLREVLLYIIDKKPGCTREDLCDTIKNHDFNVRYLGRIAAELYKEGRVAIERSEVMQRGKTYYVKRYWPPKD